MKPTLVILLALIILTSCGSIPKIKKVEPHIPCVGAVGKVKNDPLKRSFTKIAEPQLFNPLQLSLKSVEFNVNSFSAYAKSRKALGKGINIKYSDSLEVKPRYYTLDLSDRVGMVKAINHNKNHDLLKYLSNDNNNDILTGITFVAPYGVEDVLVEASHLYLVMNENKMGVQVEDNENVVHVAFEDLEIFDFKASGLCWQLDRKGNPKVMVINNHGTACPKGTERKPSKLDRTKSYLKL